MRLLIVTQGSRGDVQPYIALGRALVQTGHEVMLATNSVFQPLIAEQGLQFAEHGGDVMEVINSAQAKQWVESGRNPLTFVKGFRDFFKGAMEKSTEQVLRAAEEMHAEAIIGSGTGLYSAYSVAEALGIPYVHAFLQPVHPTTLYPMPMIPVTLRLGPIYNYLSYVACGQLFWQAMHPTFNDIRKRRFNLPPLSLVFGPLVDFNTKRQLVVYGFSSSVLPRPDSWPAWVHVTGYWFLNAGDWTAPAKLQSFLSEGPPPICIGFGSMPTRDPRRETELVLQALKISKQRGLLLSGWGGLSDADLGRNVLMIDQAPHAWLLPQCSAMVHHCGAGTTAAVFRSGVPGIPVPFFADQPFWGDRGYRLGVATRPILHRELSAESLAQAFLAAAHQDLRENASRLGVRIEAEQGATNAARIITEHLTSATRRVS
jgi:UDP:flavonoid glycosyltransferase YjiC (YdhE family)